VNYAIIPPQILEEKVKPVLKAYHAVLRQIKMAKLEDQNSA